MKKTAGLAVLTMLLTAYAVGAVAQEARVRVSPAVKAPIAQERAGQHAVPPAAPVNTVNTASCNNVTPWNATDGAKGVRPGFDDSGPYVDATFADGTVRRVREQHVTILKDGVPIARCPGLQHLDAPNPTPPELPEDPRLGRAWIERHDADLLDVIRKLVDDDEDILRALSASEQRLAGADVFRIAAYRTGVVTFYVTHQK